MFSSPKLNLSYSHYVPYIYAYPEPRAKDLGLSHFLKIIDYKRLRFTESITSKMHVSICNSKDTNPSFYSFSGTWLFQEASQNRTCWTLQGRPGPGPSLGTPWASFQLSPSSFTRPSGDGKCPCSGSHNTF